MVRFSSLHPDGKTPQGPHSADVSLVRGSSPSSDEILDWLCFDPDCLGKPEGHRFDFLDVSSKPVAKRTDESLLALQDRNSRDFGKSRSEQRLQTEILVYRNSSAGKNLEPPRDSWRLRSLRGWSNAKSWEVPGRAA